MTTFKAKQLKKGWFEIFGLEELIEKKLAALGLAPKAKTRKAMPKAKAVKQKPAEVSLAKLWAALDKQPRRGELVRAGKEKNQLFRSLVPLYLSRGLGIEVTSGLTSRFWQRFGVRYAAPNAAKALRQHVGFARATKLGRQITPNGVKYVEAALQRRAA